MAQHSEYTWYYIGLRIYPIVVLAEDERSILHVALPKLPNL